MKSLGIPVPKWPGANMIDQLRLDMIKRKLDQARSELAVIPASALPTESRLDAMNLIEQTLITITPNQSLTIEA